MCVLSQAQQVLLACLEKVDVSNSEGFEMFLTQLKEGLKNTSHETAANHKVAKVSPVVSACLGDNSRTVVYSPAMFLSPNNELFIDSASTLMVQLKTVESNYPCVSNVILTKEILDWLAVSGLLINYEMNLDHFHWPSLEISSPVCLRLTPESPFVTHS